MWEAAESATFYMISQSTRSDKRFWSDKITSPYNDPVFHYACCLQQTSLPYIRVHYCTNAQVGSTRKVSGFYSGSDSGSRLEHILSCMKFLVLYLSPSRQIPDSASHWGQDRFLLNPFQFIIHSSPPDLTLHAEILTVLSNKPHTNW
jgi:hypothetical protein